MHKVSVIIPAYNCQDYIQATINSVINQTYPKEWIEVIIVNDGSTDNTAKIIDSYKDIFKIVHTENRGVSYARNKALEHATGNFIQYLDSDDILMPDKIELQVNALAKTNGDVAYGNWQKFIETDCSIKITETIERRIEGDAEIALFTNFWCPPAAILYSKSIVEKIGSWKQWLPIIQDARYFLDAALLSGKFVYTDCNVALYREGNSNSLSKKQKLFVIDCYKNTIDIYKRWKNDLAHSPLKKEIVTASLNGIIANLRQISALKHSYCIKILLETDRYFSHKTRIKYLSRLIGYRNAELIARYLYL